MKTISRVVLLGVLGGLAAATAQAHGLHADVSQRYHALVHILQFVGVALLAISFGMWAARRRRSS